MFILRWKNTGPCGTNFILSFIRASIYFLKRFFLLCFSLWCLTAFETLLSSLRCPEKDSLLFGLSFSYFLCLRTRKIEFGSTSHFNWFFAFNSITLIFSVDHCRHGSKTHYASYSSATKPEQNKADSFDLTEKRANRDDKTPNSKRFRNITFQTPNGCLSISLFTLRHRSYRRAHTNQKLNRDRKLLEQMTYHLKR